jgi:hypothetical protein
MTTWSRHVSDLRAKRLERLNPATFVHEKEPEMNQPSYECRSCHRVIARSATVGGL